ncbi:hypothetical protein SB751_35700, partial [Cupriavidus sp. SIMBA_020]
MNAPIANTVPLRAVPAPSQKYLDYLRRDRARRRNIRLAQVLLDQLAAAPQLDLMLPLPHDVRLRSIYRS